MVRDKIVKERVSKRSSANLVDGVESSKKCTGKRGKKLDGGSKRKKRTTQGSKRSRKQKADSTTSEDTEDTTESEDSSNVSESEDEEEVGTDTDNETVRESLKKIRKRNKKKAKVDADSPVRSSSSKRKKRRHQKINAGVNEGVRGCVQVPPIIDVDQDMWASSASDDSEMDPPLTLNPDKFATHVVKKQDCYYRSNLQSCIKGLKELNLTEGQLEHIKQTPFWLMIKAIIYSDEEELTARTKKYDDDIRFMVRNYDSQNNGFRVGDGFARLDRRDVVLIFGVRDGSAPIITAKDFEATPWMLRCFEKELHEKGTKNLSQLMRSQIQSVLKRYCSMDERIHGQDVARLVHCYMLASVFCPNTSATMGWSILTYCEEFDEMCNFDWSTRILNLVVSKLKCTTNMKLAGCAMLLPYWLCEHSGLVKPTNSHVIPRFAAWDLRLLHKKLVRCTLTKNFSGLKMLNILVPTSADKQTMKKLQQECASYLGLEADLSQVPSTQSQDMPGAYGVDTQTNNDDVPHQSDNDMSCGQETAVGIENLVVNSINLEEEERTKSVDDELVAGLGLTSHATTNVPLRIDGVNRDPLISKAANWLDGGDYGFGSFNFEVPQDSPARLGQDVSLGESSTHEMLGSTKETNLVEPNHDILLLAEKEKVKRLEAEVTYLKSDIEKVAGKLRRSIYDTEKRVSESFNTEVALLMDELKTKDKLLDDLREQHDELDKNSTEMSEMNEKLDVEMTIQQQVMCVYYSTSLIDMNLKVAVQNSAVNDLAASLGKVKNKCRDLEVVNECSNKMLADGKASLALLKDRLERENQQLVATNKALECQLTKSIVDLDEVRNVSKDCRDLLMSDKERLSGEVVKLRTVVDEKNVVISELEHKAELLERENASMAVSLATNIPLSDSQVFDNPANIQYLEIVEKSELLKKENEWLKNQNHLIKQTDAERDDLIATLEEELRKFALPPDGYVGDTQENSGIGGGLVLDDIGMSTPIVNKKAAKAKGKEKAAPTEHEPGTVARGVKVRTINDDRKPKPLTPLCKEIVCVAPPGARKPRSRPLFRWDRTYPAVTKISVPLKEQIKISVETEEHYVLWGGEGPNSCVTGLNLLAILHNESIISAMIDSWAELLLKHQEKSHKKVLTYVFTSDCWKVVGSGPEVQEVRELLTKQLAESVVKDVMIFPMNTPGKNGPKQSCELHWTLLKFYVKTGQWTFFNPMKPNGTPIDPHFKNALELIAFVEPRLKIHLNDAGKNSPMFRGKRPVPLQQDTPQEQQGSCDCGIIICNVIERIIKRSSVTQITTPPNGVYPSAASAKYRAKMVESFCNPSNMKY